MATIHTVGHSNHSIERFIEILTDAAITAVADVRSSPYAKYTPHFNRDQIEHHMNARGITYVFVGDLLGGRPADPGLYDAEGHVRYDLVAGTPAFLEGIERVVRGMDRYVLAVMCGEEDPTSCHRRRLIARHLADRGVPARHLRGDGRILTEAEVEAREAIDFPERFQLSLMTDPGWRSIHVVPRSAGRELR
jgi:uncharacterized protein (DUF488 family)